MLDTMEEVECLSQLSQLTECHQSNSPFTASDIGYVTCIAATSKPSAEDRRDFSEISTDRPPVYGTESASGRPPVLLHVPH